MSFEAEVPQSHLDDPPRIFLSSERRRLQLYQMLYNTPPPSRPRLVFWCRDPTTRNCERRCETCQPVPSRCRVVLKLRISFLNS